MTLEARQVLEIWKNDKSVDLDLTGFSWYILAFLSKANLRDCMPEQVCDYYFPSPKAAIHWIDNHRPDLVFYHLLVTDCPPNCPYPYFLEK